MDQIQLPATARVQLLERIIHWPECLELRVM
jgi:hypothetical protein